jgi:hypothetical protein
VRRFIKKFVPNVPNYTLSEIRSGNYEGKRIYGRLGCRWEDNIKDDLKEIGFEDVDFICPAYDKVQWRL